MSFILIIMIKTTYAPTVHHVKFKTMRACKEAQKILTKNKLRDTSALFLCAAEGGK